MSVTFQRMETCLPCYRAGERAVGQESSNRGVDAPSLIG